MDSDTSESRLKDIAGFFEDNIYSPESGLIASHRSKVDALFLLTLAPQTFRDGESVDLKSMSETLEPFFGTEFVTTVEMLSPQENATSGLTPNVLHAKRSCRCLEDTQIY